jgi:nitrate/nitrite-specific signal transduction histidine kinase
VIEDDGVGLDARHDTGGEQGDGLELHSTMMAILGGALCTGRRSGGGTRVTLTLPPSAA